MTLSQIIAALILSAAESDYKPLPPPTADETHLNLQTKVARVKVTSSKPSKGGLVQCNVKVRPRARDRFEESYARAAQSKPDLTRGEFFEALLAAFDVKGPTKAADIAARFVNWLSECGRAWLSG